jgi:hypothetical protein
MRNRIFNRKDRKGRKIRDRNISRKVTHVPVGTTQQMKMNCAALKATTENPPMAPFGKGGGPKDRGIFASNRHFHERRKDAKVRNRCHFDRREKSLLSSPQNDGLCPSLSVFAPWREKNPNPNTAITT